MYFKCFQCVDLSIVSEWLSWPPWSGWREPMWATGTTRRPTDPVMGTSPPPTGTLAPPTGALAPQMGTSAPQMGTLHRLAPLPPFLLPRLTAQCHPPGQEGKSQSNFHPPTFLLTTTPITILTTMPIMMMAGRARTLVLVPLELLPRWVRTKSFYVQLSWHEDSVRSVRTNSLIGHDI